MYLGGEQEWQMGRVGAGAPPVETEPGWLEIYHGNQRAERLGEVGRDLAGAVVSALDDPARLTHAAAGPIMVPEADFEREGFVPRVVFPTGVVEREGRQLVYYGAADTCCAVVVFDRGELMGALRPIQRSL